MRHYLKEKSWKTLLGNEFEKEYFLELEAFVENAYQTKVCYPDKNQIFSAFNACSFDDVKVVIIGQDPYHGPQQAHGLSFSVQKNTAHPPSLKNIFKELQDDLSVPYPIHGDLTSWAKQGVLLLNATLTVESHKAGSHQNKGWEQYTDQVIEILSQKKENLVFMLWGGFAKKKGKRIDSDKHCVLTSGHPSPLSANRGYWFGHHHFSQANQYLVNNGLLAIQWEL